MQFHATNFRVTRKVCVKGKYRHLVLIGERANEEVDVRPLYATRSALIEEASSAFVRWRFGRQVIERAELVPKPVELGGRSNAAQNLLTNAARHACARLIDERRQLPNRALLHRSELAAGATPKSNRPHRCVDQDIHRCRPCLWS